MDQSYATGPESHEQASGVVSGFARALRNATPNLALPQTRRSTSGREACDEDVRQVRRFADGVRSSSAAQWQGHGPLGDAQVADGHPVPE